MNSETVKILKANHRAEVADLKAQRQAEVGHMQGGPARDMVYLHYAKLIAQVDAAYARKMRALQGRRQ